MKTDFDKLARIKRAKPSVREQDILAEYNKHHPAVEKAARAISDWQSEADWPLHVDKAIRAIEAISEQLGREGFVEAKAYLRSVIWEEPKPRANAVRVS
jgi:hypothetical protein